MSQTGMASPPGNAASPGAHGPVWGMLIALSACHFINDVMQSMLQALYPLLEAEFSLKYWQIGALTLAFQGTASIFQPIVGMVTDKHPMPRSLPVGMAMTFIGIWMLAKGGSYAMIVLGASMIGLGSAVFHPESSRAARLASGGRYGTAQSLFQVGGNTGSALGPVLAALIVVPLGRDAVAWFSIAAAIGIVLLWQVGTWSEGLRKAASRIAARGHGIPRARVNLTIIVLLALVFSKYVYQTTLSSFLTLYLIERFAVSQTTALIVLAIFLGGMAAGVMLGGTIADRIGTRSVIWFSIMGALPFTLALPWAGFWLTCVLVFVIGLIMASAFPAVIVYAQELLPGRPGMVAGLFFGFAFGVAGVAAVLLGMIADVHGIEFVYHVSAWLPALGVIAVFLPPLHPLGRA